jgi:ATP-dependent DNA helicase Q1
MCDNCALSSEVKEVDVSDLSKLVVSMVQETQAKDQRVTMLQLGDKLRNKHKDLIAELKRDEVEHLVIKLIVDSVLVRSLSMFIVLCYNLTRDKPSSR